MGQSAEADTCAGKGSFPNYQWTRTDNDIEGVRAPIQMRLDGAFCTAPVTLPFNAAWIGIQNQAATKLAQIGLYHYQPSPGNARFCRFWAKGTGNTKCL
jgi:hypothetical protein